MSAGTENPPTPAQTKNCVSLDYQRRQRREWLQRYGVAESEVMLMTDDALIATGRALLAEISTFQRKPPITNNAVQNRLSSKCPARHCENLITDNPITPRGWVNMLDLLTDQSKRGRGYMVALLGNRGTGKTQLAVALIWKCSLVMPCRYVTASQLFREIRSTYAYGSVTTEDEVFHRFSTSTLLVIDECHQRAETAAENNALVAILDARYTNRLDTVLIANQTQTQFAASMGSSIVSRMHETGDALVCDWPSFRAEGAWIDSK